MIGRASAEDIRLLGGLGGMLSVKNFEVCDSQIAGNALQLSIIPSPGYFVLFQMFYDPIRRTFLAPGVVCAHPAQPPDQSCQHVYLNVEVQTS